MRSRNPSSETCKLTLYFTQQPINLFGLTVFFSFAGVSGLVVLAVAGMLCKHRNVYSLAHVMVQAEHQDVGKMETPVSNST